MKKNKGKNIVEKLKKLGVVNNDDLKNQIKKEINTRLDENINDKKESLDKEFYKHVLKKENYILLSDIKNSVFNFNL